MWELPLKSLNCLGVSPLDGPPKASGHIIFDVKMAVRQPLDECKARWALDGHLTPDADYSTYYAGVVSQESVCIVLTYAALNGLGVLVSLLPTFAMPTYKPLLA
jgi:hypothetical protein